VNTHTHTNTVVIFLPSQRLEIFLNWNSRDFDEKILYLDTAKR